MSPAPVEPAESAGATPVFDMGAAAMHERTLPYAVISLSGRQPLENLEQDQVYAAHLMDYRLPCHRRCSSCIKQV
jgi:hypothetical protein